MEAEDNCDKLEVAKVQVGGYDANQIYAYYSDTAQYLVVWLIADPEDDQACYYLAMEFTQDNADLVAVRQALRPIGIKDMRFPVQKFGENLTEADAHCFFLVKFHEKGKNAPVFSKIGLLFFEEYGTIKRVCAVCTGSFSVCFCSRHF